MTNPCELFAAWLQTRHRRNTAAECENLKKQALATESSSLAGILCKLRWASLIDVSADALWLSGLADLERLCGDSVPPPPPEGGH